MINYRTSRGFSLIEVVVTSVILAVALLGLAGLQARALTGEYESFSRGQGLLLVNDMADRMSANLTEVKTAQYDQPTVIFGTGYVNDCIAGNPTAAAQMACCATKGTVSARDFCEWDLTLKGVGQLAGGDNKVGSMMGARGCVFQSATDTNVYEIDVVWQGRDTSGAVASDLTCGATEIPSNRRAASRRIRVAVLG